MKLIYIEATKQDLEANKRVADALCDALTGFFDCLTRVNTVKKIDFIESDEEG